MNYDVIGTKTLVNHIYLFLIITALVIFYPIISFFGKIFTTMENTEGPASAEGDLPSNLPEGNSPTDVPAATTTMSNISSTASRNTILDDIENAFSEQFPPKSETIYASPEELHVTVRMLGSQYGMDVIRQGMALTCSRYGQTRKSKKENDCPPEKRRKRENFHKCGCTWKLNFAKVNKKDKEDHRVKITSVSYRHTNGCIPTANELVVTRKHNGAYIQMISQEKLFEVIQLMDAPGKLHPATLRELLKPCFPKLAPITAKDLYNIRLKAKRLAPRLKSSGQLQLATDSYNFTLKGIDDDDAIAVDQASRNASEMLALSLQESSSGWQLAHYLRKLREADSTFTFRIAYDPKGAPTGVVWMTATMRAAFELFGEVLFLDAMKRKLNSLHWPYVGPVVIDGDKEIFVVAEGFVVGEHHEAYAWVLNSLFDMAPGCTREQVYVLYGDLFVDNAILDQCGMSDITKVVWDHHHIRDAWKDKLKNYFLNVDGAFDIMLYANNADKFNEAAAMAKRAVEGNMEATEFIDSYASVPEKFSRYCIREYLGNLERHGSSHAEQNHSSFVSRIGDVILDEPHIGAKKLLDRHVDICKERNTQIYR